MVSLAIDVARHQGSPHKHRPLQRDELPDDNAIRKVSWPPENLTPHAKPGALSLPVNLGPPNGIVNRFPPFQAYIARGSAGSFFHKTNR
jgi:hypothetical protein